MTCAEMHAADAAFEALLWEAEYGVVAAQATLIEWALAPYRVFPKKLQELEPDIIITKVQMGRLMSMERLESAVEDVLLRKVKIVNMDPKSLSDVWNNIMLVAHSIGCLDRGERLVQSLQERMDIVKGISMGRSRKRILCIDWNEPLLVAGGWVSDLVDLAGGVDICSLQGKSKGVLSWERIRELNPEVLIFANFRWNLNQTKDEVVKMMQKGKLDAIKSLQLIDIVVADGTCLFSRPGPHLVESLEALAEILHPESQAFGHLDTLWSAVDFTVAKNPDDSSIRLSKSLPT